MQSVLYRGGYVMFVVVWYFLVTVVLSNELVTHDIQFKRLGGQF